MITPQPMDLESDSMSEATTQTKLSGTTTTASQPQVFVQARAESDDDSIAKVIAANRLLEKTQDLNTFVPWFSGILGGIFLLAVLGFILEQLGCLKSQVKAIRMRRNPATIDDLDYFSDYAPASKTKQKPKPKRPDKHLRRRMHKSPTHRRNIYRYHGRPPHHHRSGGKRQCQLTEQEKSYYRSLHEQSRPKNHRTNVNSSRGNRGKESFYDDPNNMGKLGKSTIGKPKRPRKHSSDSRKKRHGPKGYKVKPGPKSGGFEIGSRNFGEVKQALDGGRDFTPGQHRSDIVWSAGSLTRHIGPNDVFRH